MNRMQQRHYPPVQPENNWRLATYLLLVVAYVVIGKLGLMLALPPGYASPIFPPAGIAVAAAFIGGRRTLPWIFLGSLLLNIWVGYSASHQINATGFIAAAAIAAASMLQAAAGGRLLRRIIGYPASLDNGHDLLYFLLLAPVICLTSASLSVSSLAVLGIVDTASLAASWVAWWVGDTLGVVVMLPLVMIAAGEPRALWQSRIRTVAVPMLLIFAFFVVIFIKANKWEFDDSLVEYRQLSQQVVGQIQGRLEEQEFLLEQTAGLFIHDTRDRITREEFHRFTRKSLLRFSMIHAVEWAPLVDAVHRASFEAAQRKELPGFEIRERNSAGSLQRAGERAQFYPVTYVEPLKGNEPAVGFDLASTPERRAALSKAIESEMAVATSPIHLVQERQEQAGMLLLLPVKASGNGPGVVLAVLRMGDFTDSLLPAARSMLYVRLIDVDEHKTLYDNFAAESQAALYERNFNFGTRHYQLQTAPTPAYTMQHKGWQSWGVLAASTLGTGLLGALLLLGTGYTARIVRQVKERTQELKESESRFRNILDHAPIGMGIASMDGRFMQINQAFCAIVGYEKSELEQMTIREITHPEDLSLDLANKQRLISGEISSYRMEKRYIRKDGQIVWTQISASMEKDASGAPLYLIGQIEDITERRQAKIALRDSEERLNMALAGADMATWDWHIPSGALTFNARWAEIQGYTLEELPPRLESWETRVFPDDMPHVREALDRHFRGETPAYESEHRVRHKDGHWVWVLGRGKVVERDATGSPVRAVGTALDITERKHAEEALRKSAEEIEDLYNHAPCGYHSLDEDGVICKINDTELAWLGYTRDEIVGRMKWQNLITPASLQVFQINFPLLKKQGFVHNLEIEITRKDGAILLVLINATAIYDPDGNFLMSRSTLFDITERKNVEKELRDNKEILERIFETTHFHVVLLDPEFNFIRVNRAYADACGSEPEFFAGKNHFALYPSEELESKFKRVVETCIPYTVYSRPFEWPDKPELGTTYWDLAVYPVKGAFGKVEGVLFTLLEVTERKLAEKRLRSSNQLLDSIINNIPNMIFLKRASDLRFELFNRAGEKLVGHSQEELLGRNDYDFFPKDQADFFTSKDREVFEQNGVVDIPEEPIETPNGTRILHTRKLALRDEQGQPQYLLGISEDITESKHAEEALRESEERFRFLVEQSPFSVQILSPDGWTLQVNHAFETLFGITLEGLKDYNILADQQLVRLGLMPNIQRGFSGEANSIPAAEYNTVESFGTGKKKWVRANIYPVKDKTGKIRLVILVHEDITERKQAEEKLHTSETNLRAILDNSPYLVWLKDTAGRFVAVNKPFFRTTGLKQIQDVLGKTDLDLWPKELAEKYRADDAEVISTRQQKLAEEPFIMKNGEVHWVETFKAPIVDRSGQLLGTTGFAQDITERKQYIEGLRKAQELAEEIATAKSSFLANMSHEIRTPMNAIIGLSQLALNKQTTPEVRSYLEKIFNSSSSLLDILNDILDLSKLEAGRMTIEHANFDMDTVLENLNDLFAVRAEDKYLDFNIEVSPGIPRDLVGDALRLQQVLANLLGNAIKFTERGSVTLRIGLKQTGEGQATLLFSVEDTGIGIAKEDIHKLFHPFRQVDDSITRRFGGTGLGLSISHELLQLMGSDFNVESTLGKGTTFSFELVFGIAFHAAHGKVAQRKNQRRAGALASELRDHGQPLAGAHVLVVEDDAINQQVVREFLELSGVAVTIANNGKEALEQLDQGRFDAVLMDVHMPVMNGIEATQRIRANPRFAGLPVIALTADIASEDRENYLSSGMNDFIAKPFHPRELVSTLLRWVKPDEETAMAPGTGHAESTRPVAGSKPGLDNLPGFDLGNILKMLNGNWLQLIELLVSFMNDMADAPAEIEAKAVAGDFSAARELAHKLKGTAGNLGARSLHAVAGQMERELKAGRHNPATLNAFREEFNRTMSTIAGLHETEKQMRTPGTGGNAEAIRSAALKLDHLLGENDFVTEERLNELKKNLLPGKLDQFDALRKHIKNTQYAKARQVLRMLVELPDIQDI